MKDTLNSRVDGNRSGLGLADEKREVVFY